MDNFKGFSFGYDARRYDYLSDECRDSLDKLKKTGSEWVAIAFSGWQDCFRSTEIYYDYKKSVTESSLLNIIKYAKQLELKVCLKPIVDCNDGVCRGFIDFPDQFFELGYWNKWFESYYNFILHYARLAEDTHCEMLCIGCEMCGTERKEENWTSIIRDIREVYNGLLIYNANHDNLNEAKWFDKLDYIGVSAYFTVGEPSDYTEETMMRNWEKVKPKMEELYSKLNKKVVFMEIGCRSSKGNSEQPYNYIDGAEYDEEEQANFYSSAFKTFSNQVWFGGYFWWEWPVHLYRKEDARKDMSYSVYGKKAEAVVQEWYKKSSL